TTTTTEPTTTTTTTTTTEPTTTTTTTTTTEPTTTTTTTTEPVRIVYGDVDLNGSVSLADVVMVLQYASNAQKYPLDADALRNADVNGDNVVDAKDAFIIQRVDAKQISQDSLPIHE
ncbi:MAG: dockerin type I repeat-containing protein, partial [Ruminococcus sp.]|nr:dockerin type I repeat-containing protein [Ruminococcus sp.]